MTNHHQDCGWHVDQYPFECTCGAITDADLLRAQVLGEPLPRARDPWAGHERDPMRPLPGPRAHAQFKLREAGQC